MNDPSVSVIVVSLGRPASLKRCLLAISQLYYDPFEVVIVADKAGLDAIKDAGQSELVKTAHYEEPNISQARNIGLSSASGEIIAFIDDDAVPEPGWLYHLTKPFQDPNIDAAGGYVRGRNGISFQSTAMSIDEFGGSEELKLSGDQPEIFEGRPGKAIKTEGTNCAFRRSLFKELGGFDPAFHYYLDESDLNIRIAHAGKHTAIVPMAEVHHSVAASDRRSADRLPTSLFEIGASLIVFLRKHAGDSDHDPHIENATAAHKSQLVRHMVRGNCEPRDVGRLLATLRYGVEDGYRRHLEGPPTVSEPTEPFMKMSTAMGPRDDHIISGYFLHSNGLRQKARSAVQSGKLVSLYLFSRTTLFHRTQFHSDGYWQQIGGLFGKAERSERFFQATNLADRVSKETRRVATQRHPWDTKHTEGDVG